MELQLINGKKLSLSDEVFGYRYNEGLIHQVVTAHMAGARQGTKAQKTRAEVRGGGIKPWRQKGTGRARAGTIRSPLWRTGGRTFAAKPRDFAQKVNRKMYQRAMMSILSELVRQQRLKLIDDITISAPKTRELVAQLDKLALGKVLIVLANEDKNIELAARNIPDVHVTYANHLDPVTLISFENVLATEAAIKMIEEKFV